MLQAQRDYFGAHTWKVLPEKANAKCTSHTPFACADCY